MGVLSELIKGATTAESISVGGALRPEAADAFIDLLVQQNAFMSQIYVHRMGRLVSDLNANTIAARSLVRLAEGTDASAYTNPTNKGKTLTALAQQFFAQVTFSAISDNANDPGFEDRLAAMFAKSVANDLVDLGFNGTDDDYTGSAFLELNKGWIHLAKNNTDCVKVDINTLSDDYISKMKSVIAAADDMYKADCVWIMKTSEYEGFVEDIGSEPGGVGFMVSGMVPTFMGHTIVPVPYCPAGTLLFTPLQNIVIGINRDINRYREVKGTKRAIEYTFDMATDFCFVCDAAVVIGYNS